VNLGLANIVVVGDENVVAILACRRCSPVTRDENVVAILACRRYSTVVVSTGDEVIVWLYIPYEKTKKEDIKDGEENKALILTVRLQFSYLYSEAERNGYVMQ